MDCYAGSRLRLKRSGRKQPTGYLLGRGEGNPPGRSLFIPGHYEVACGGCDTLDGYETIYGMIRDAHKHGHDVLYEGLLISGESARPIALHTDGLPLTVFALNTPIDVCIDSINARRRAKRGPDAPPIKERNTIAKARAVEIAMGKIIDAGIPARWVNRDEAVIFIRNELNI